jgi:hypothetical protein
MADGLVQFHVALVQQSPVLAHLFLHSHLILQSHLLRFHDVDILLHVVHFRCQVQHRHLELLQRVNNLLLLGLELVELLS